jgi:hypothetical protein
MPFAAAVEGEFDSHAQRLRERSRARLEAVQLRSVVENDADREAVDEDDALGKSMPGETWRGCTNMRTLRALLAKIDSLGFERSGALARLCMPILPFSMLLVLRRSTSDAVSFCIRALGGARALQG